LSRVAFIPVVIAVYAADTRWSYAAAAGLFAVASLTDWLDGYLARRLNVGSAFGAFLDPVADKLLVSAILVLLASVYPQLLIPILIIISREILISALREWMASRGAREAVAVAWTGKLKTTLQMFAIIALLLANSALPELVFQLGVATLYVSAVMSLWSMFQYFRQAWPVLFPAD
jgi:CDP-diacylglycerol--glycerol-3-phosphate 3-phosphatidyltransferase